MVVQGEGSLGQLGRQLLPRARNLGLKRRRPVGRPGQERAALAAAAQGVQQLARCGGGIATQHHCTLGRILL